MGVVLAKFKKEKTTTEVLEKLEERIQQIEKYSFTTQEQKKRFVSNFLAISIGIYVIAFLVFYFLYFPVTWKERFLYSMPLLIFPVFIAFFRKAFTWYFQRKLNKNSTQLNALRSEKKKILEQVMDKETYKVAVSLLTRFADKTNGAKSMTALTPRANIATPARPSQSMRTLTTNCSNPSNIPPRSLNTSVTTTPRGAQPPKPAEELGAAIQSRQLAFSPLGQELRRQTPFPVVNQQDKGVFERIVDILVGDGPQDRFAMICKDCFAHNGMALKEEFDFTTFRCAFCNTLNPSRKSRPIAPPLPLQVSVTAGRILARDSSDSSESSDDDKQVVVRTVPTIKMSEVSSPETEVGKTDDEKSGTETEEENEKEKEREKDQATGTVEENKKDI